MYSLSQGQGFSTKTFYKKIKVKGPIPIPPSRLLLPLTDQTWAPTCTAHAWAVFPGAHRFPILPPKNTFSASVAFTCTVSHSLPAPILSWRRGAQGGLDPAQGHTAGKQQPCPHPQATGLLETQTLGCQQQHECPPWEMGAAPSHLSRTLINPLPRDSPTPRPLRELSWNQSSAMGPRQEASVSEGE